VRSYLLRSNVPQLILDLQKFDEIADEQFMGTQSWALGCLLQGKNPPASHGQAIRSLPRLLFLLETCNEKIQLDVLKALTSFTEFSGELNNLSKINRQLQSAAMHWRTRRISSKKSFRFSTAKTTRNFDN
jgi:hypothetical protein